MKNGPTYDKQTNEQTQTHRTLAKCGSKNCISQEKNMTFP